MTAQKGRSKDLPNRRSPIHLDGEERSDEIVETTRVARRDRTVVAAHHLHRERVEVCGRAGQWLALGWRWVTVKKEQRGCVQCYPFVRKRTRAVGWAVALSRRAPRDAAWGDARARGEALEGRHVGHALGAWKALRRVINS